MIISFDAANTLVDVDWNPGRFASDCAVDQGIRVDAASPEIYNNLLAGRWRHFCELNLTRDEAIVQGFWLELTRDWLAAIGSKYRPDELLEYANGRIYSTDSPVYQPFADTVECLSMLKANGHRMIVVSNWDVSLHRVLRFFELASYFERVFASLEWGPEKPDMELFRIVEREMNLGPDRFLHVGDNPIDDFHGARHAGWQALLIDRSLEARDGHRLSRLTDLLEVV